MNILHQNDCFSDWQSISSIFWFKIKHSFAMFCTCTNSFCLLSVVCVGLAPIVLEYHINERECGMIKLLENKPL